MQQHSKSKLNSLFQAATLMMLIMASSATVFAETHIVEMNKFKFVPEEITIRAGDTVRWVNTERRQYHTIWFKDLGEVESSELFPEEHLEKTFDQPGDYPYLCGPHWEDRGMKGIVHVLP